MAKIRTRDRINFALKSITKGPEVAGLEYMRDLMRKMKMIDIELIDTLDGEVISLYEDGERWFRIGAHKFGIHYTDSYESIDTWVHEFTEHAVGHQILHNLAYGGFNSAEIRRYIGVFYIKAKNYGIYCPTMKHMITSLCTESTIDGIKIGPDEFSILFNIEDGELPKKFKTHKKDALSRLCAELLLHNWRSLDDNEDEAP